MQVNPLKPKIKIEILLCCPIQTTYRQSDQIGITWWRNKRAAISKIDSDMVKKLKNWHWNTCICTTLGELEGYVYEKYFK